MRDGYKGLFIYGTKTHKRGQQSLFIMFGFVTHVQGQTVDDEGRENGRTNDLMTLEVPTLQPILGMAIFSHLFTAGLDRTHTVE